MPQHAVHKEIAVPAQNKNQLSVSDSIRCPKFGSNTQICDLRNFCNAWCSAAPDGSKQANGQMAHPKQRMKALPQRDVFSHKTGTFRSKHNWLCPTCRSEVSPKKQECSKCGCMRPNLGAPRVISAVQRAGNQWRNPESEHMKRFGRPQQRNNRSQRSVRNKHQPKETIRYDNNNFMHKHRGSRDNSPVARVAKKRMEKKAKTRTCECAALKAQFGWAMKCSLCRGNNNNKPAHGNPNFGKGSPAGRKRQSPKFLTVPGMVLI